MSLTRLVLRTRVHQQREADGEDQAISPLPKLVNVVFMGRG